MHTIDLKNYSIRTDLAIEAVSNQENILKDIINITRKLANADSHRELKLPGYHGRRPVVVAG